MSQERLAEKEFFASLGIPTPPFAAVEFAGEFDAAVRDIGLPAVLKTRRFGYDGKGQVVIRTPADMRGRVGEARRAAAHPRRVRAVRPRALDHRGPRPRRDGRRRTRSSRTSTSDGILHRSIAPAANTGEELTERAAEYASRVLTELDYVGVLTIEWFQDGPRLLANEMAPRVHNSGHWTIDAAMTSQFENHLRAICGLPLGRCDAVGHSAMYNFIGSVPLRRGGAGQSRRETTRLRQGLAA